MPLVLANRVQETSTTTGTGTLTLDGAVLGYQTFAAGIGSGNTCYYAITSSTGAWEVGIGTVGTGTLARTTLLSSSTGSLVSFTGTLNVYVTYPSEKSVNLDASNIITGYPVTVTDNVFTLQDNIDPTKQAQFQLSGLLTGTTYVYTLPTSNGGASTLVDLNSAQTISASKTFSGTANVFGSSANTGSVSVATGATTTGLTKTVNIGTGGVSGSTTNITVGATAGTSTTTMNGQTDIGGTTTSVNFARVVGAATGAAPTISAAGSDANIGLVLNSKGTGVVALGGSTVANSAFQAIPTTSSVNYIEAKGAATGQPVYLTAKGTDTNIPFIIQSKGTQPFYFVVNNAIQFGAFNTASAVNYPYATGGSTGNPAVLAAIGSDANVNLKLVPQGTGDVQITGTAYSPNFNLTDAATIAWDTATAGGQVATFTFVSSNRTMGAPTNLTNGAFYALAVIQNAGSNTLTWSSVFKWAAGTAPTLSTAAGAKDYFTFRSDGTNLYQQGISQAVA